MGERCDSKFVFPLTGLQIGDIQAYLSDLSIFIAAESNRFYILVDNRPWLRDFVARPAQIWQLMVTKSRLSPFANSKAQRRRTVETESLAASHIPKRDAWYKLIDAASRSKKKVLLPMKNLRNPLFLSSEVHRILYGFIVFEVSWSDVRGINYMNELQTDTSMAIESKTMRRWEFESISQAASLLSHWFSGSSSDKLRLKQFLDSSTGEIFHDAFETPSISREIELDYSSDESSSDSEEDDDTIIEDKHYRDVLITLRFNDHDLPFKVADVVMSDLRLLRLLEAGLPSWVIFFQSYPGFSKLYRPWMCPLARALYVVISVITVLIGFYDLYKNVPVLKATASRLCGPLFDWIETWDMVSRIKYLGTMLFLHNFQKALTWFLQVTRTTRSFISVFTQPLVEPFFETIDFLIPAWNLLFDVIGSVFSLFWVVLSSTYETIGDIIEIVLTPVWFVVSILRTLAYPVVWIVWEIVYVPIRLILAVSSLASAVSESVWVSISGLASASEVTVRSHEVSMWRSLWNDLFSHVFRAVRSILNGFVAFFTACNRHRLSIYNHLRNFTRKMRGHQPSHTRNTRIHHKQIQSKRHSD